VKGSSEALTARIHAMGARDVGVSHGSRAAAFLLARPGVAREERAALAVRLWYSRGGRTARKRSSLGALSDARGGVMSELLLDAAGRRRSPATLPHFHAGRPPRNKGMRYPADPPTTEEIIAVMRHAGDRAHGRRLRGLIVVLWRAGLRICEALALTEADLDPRRGSLLVRRGKGGRRREVGIDDWAWEQLAPWLQARVQLPVGPLFCVVNGPTRGRPWAAAAARSELRRVAREAGVRRRFAPHQLRHAHAVEMAREGVPLVIQRQLGHTNLGITSIYLQGIDNTEIIDTVHARRAPMVPVHSSLRL
jgi:integrase